MYTPAWRNHPNLGWGGNNNNMAPKPNNFQLQQARPPHQEKKPSLEETMQQLATTIQTIMTSTNTNLKNQAATIHNLEVQVGQISNLLTGRPQGLLLSNTEMNPKEHIKVITL